MMYHLNYNAPEMSFLAILCPRFVITATTYVIFLLQNGANVLFFTFINPATMKVPLAFKKLGKSFSSP